MPHPRHCGPPPSTHVSSPFLMPSVHVASVGCKEGRIVGAGDGHELGAGEGAALGRWEGAALGRCEGASLGFAEGSTVGLIDVGLADGRALGRLVGGRVGAPLGTTLGDAVGRCVGRSVHRPLAANCLPPMYLPHSPNAPAHVNASPSQSRSRQQCWSTAQPRSHACPPQSTSVSLPFFSPSSHDAPVGLTVGRGDGAGVGQTLGDAVGARDGTGLGRSVGLCEGSGDGFIVGCIVGFPVGYRVGWPLGAGEGPGVGQLVGAFEGLGVGADVVGLAVGEALGALDGAGVGAAVVGASVLRRQYLPPYPDPCAHAHVRRDRSSHEPPCMVHATSPKKDAAISTPGRTSPHPWPWFFHTQLWVGAAQPPVPSVQSTSSPPCISCV